MCDPIEFENVTPEKFASLEDKAMAAAGIAVSGDTGEATAEGVTIQWSYDRASQKLTMQCTKKPFVIPCSLIDGKISEIVGD